MQLPHTLNHFPNVIRSGRLLGFSQERPPESQNAPDAKPETKPSSAPAESDAQRVKNRERRDNRNRRETWERACEQLTDEQLLQTLGELHVKSEDTFQKLDGVNASKQPEQHQQLTRQVEFIEEQLAGAREVWTARKHAKQPFAEWSKEVTAIESQLATARSQFEQQPKTSPRYADERLKFAMLEEQAYLARGAENLTTK